MLLTSAVVLPLASACSSRGSDADPTAPVTASADSEPTTGDGPTDVAAKVAALGLPASALTLTVAKDPTCGCCQGWISHMEEHLFRIEVDHPPSMDQAFAEAGIAPELASCHLATTADGVLVVGHTPARYVLEYLAEPVPGSRGIGVPAMPIGTPGMESGSEFQPYDVLVLRPDGSADVHASVASAADQMLV